MTETELNSKSITIDLELAGCLHDQKHDFHVGVEVAFGDLLGSLWRHSSGCLVIHGKSCRVV